MAKIKTEQTHVTGRVKFFKRSDEYGYITFEGLPDAKINLSTLRRDGFDQTPKEGSMIEVDLGTHPQSGKPMVTKVHTILPPDDSAKASDNG